MHFDGSCEPFNPGGRMGFGVHISDENGTVLFAHSSGEDFAPTNTNNVAEYRALNIGLEWLIEQGYHTSAHVLIYGDSALVINQMNGAWKVRGGRYYTEYQRAAEHKPKFKSVTFNWVRRELNEVADVLSKQV